MRWSPLATLATLVVVGCGASAPSDATAPTPGLAEGDGGPSRDASSPDSGPRDAGDRDAATGADAGVTGDADSPAACAMLQPGTGPTSRWAHVDVPGHLAYSTLPTGERLLDFSSAGYRGGGVAIPTAPVRATVQPSGGSDDTTAIQKALDTVGAMTPTGGLRGAVLLGPGTFMLQGTLSLGTSGVVLRGSGSGSGGTVVTVAGSPRTVITMGSTGSWTETGASSDITDDYVPSGATTVHVASTAGLSVGTPVLVDRPVTAAWIHFMGMDTLVRNGVPETWLSAGSTLHADRTIVAVTGDAVTLDAPLSDTFDVSTWGSGAPRPSVHAYTFTSRVEQIGLESLHLVAPAQTVPISQPIFGVLSLDAARDAWVRDVVADEFTTGIVIGGSARSVTVEDCTVQRTAPIDGSAGYPFQYSVAGQGVLVQRCTAKGDDVFSYATQARTPGPNVVLGLTASGTHTNLQPHQRWATGLLVDGVQTPTGGIALMNRGWDGSGHGWAIGFGVLWNSTASGLLVQQPPGAQNWAIGSTGTEQTAGAPGGDGGLLPQGIVDSPGLEVAPKSLYLAQLCERLGPSALHSIGY